MNNDNKHHQHYDHDQHDDDGHHGDSHDDKALRRSYLGAYEKYEDELKRQRMTCGFTKDRSYLAACEPRRYAHPIIKR